jgi:hypothetical protein
MGCNGLEILNPPNTPTWFGSYATDCLFILNLTCYILIPPLLFLIPHHPFIHLSMKSPIPRIALPLSPNSPIPFLLTHLIFFLTLPPNCSVSRPCYTLGHILPIASLSSGPTELMETPQSSGSQLILTKLIFIP